MDRRTWLAMILCLLIFMGWQKFYIEPRMPVQRVATTSSTEGQSQPTTPETAKTPDSKLQTTASTPAKPSTPKQTVTLKSATGDVVVSDRGTFVDDWKLKDYRVGLADTTAAIDLTTVTHQKGEIELAFEDPAYAYLTSVDGKLTQTPGGALWTYEDEKVRLTREMKASPDLPYIQLSITAQFKSKKPGFAFLSLDSQNQEKDAEEHDRQFVYWANQKIERTLVKDVATSGEPKEIKFPVKFIGATNHYFLMALVAEDPSQPLGLLQPTHTSGKARMSLVYPISQDTLTLPLRVYFGPKKLELLKSVDPRLDHAVDFGWFTVFAYPLLNFLKWLHGFAHNYGVAIILLTLLLKVATYPLTYKSMKSMKQMSALQPQMQKLREKHKDDKVALNQEMMTLMRTHGYNPAAGCLPMLIQIPIFIALYQVLRNSIELYHAPFAFWIHDLSSQDPFYVTPILLTITMFVQQKLTPNTATDPAQQKMLQFMPLMFGAMMINLASGLTIYMLVNALAGIVQQIVLNKKLDVRHAPTLAARAR